MESNAWSPYAAVVGQTDREAQDERRWAILSAEGDARAFRCIVERHYRGVFRFVSRLAPTAADAEDLTQEAFSRAYLNIDRFDPRYRLSTWLYRIALNVTRDHMRSAKRRERPCEPSSPLLDGEDISRSPLQHTAAMDEARRLHRAMMSISDSYREVLVLKDLEQLTFAEISKITGGSVPGLKIRALRARAAMRKELERLA